MNKSINDYNFFELCDFEINNKKRDEISSTINKLIWKEFLLNDFEKVISEEDIGAINKMAEEDKDIVAFIIAKYPNINDVLWKIAENVKKEIILDFIESQLSELQNAYKFVQNNDFKKTLKEKIFIYSKAKKVTEEDKWEELHRLKMGLNKINQNGFQV